MRYVQLLEDAIRQQCGNQTFTSSAGIQPQLILQALNDAQERLQSILYDNIPDLQIFDGVIELSIVGRQNEYPLPNDAYLNCALRKVEYSRDGQAWNYISLIPTTKAFIENEICGEPSHYTNANRLLIISPMPETARGKLRITYVRSLDTLDKRRGTVSGTPVNDGTNYTAILLAQDAVLDETVINGDENLCINDRHGNVIYYNIPYTSYDAGSKTITLDSGVLMSEGTILDGHYVTIGEYTTTHSELPRNCERYLMTYGRLRVQNKSSNTDSGDTNPELAAMEGDIVAAFGRTLLDTKRISLSSNYRRYL